MRMPETARVTVFLGGNRRADCTTTFRTLVYAFQYCGVNVKTELISNKPKGEQDLRLNLRPSPHIPASLQLAEGTLRGDFSGCCRDSGE